MIILVYCIGENANLLEQMCVCRSVDVSRLIVPVYHTLHLCLTFNGLKLKLRSH